MGYAKKKKKEDVGIESVFQADGAAQSVVGGKGEFKNPVTYNII